MFDVKQLLTREERRSRGHVILNIAELKMTELSLAIKNESSVIPAQWKTFEGKEARCTLAATMELLN